MVRTLQLLNASPGWKLPTVGEMEPLRRQRSGFYTHLCRKGEKWPTKAFLQPTKTECVMCLCLPFSLMQDLSLKRILCQLITCGQSYMTSVLIKWLIIDIFYLHTSCVHLATYDLSSLHRTHNKDGTKFRSGGGVEWHKMIWLLVDTKGLGGLQKASMTLHLCCFKKIKISCVCYSCS